MDEKNARGPAAPPGETTPVQKPEREMSLDEWVERLPPPHRARVELDGLRNEVDMVGAINHRSERIAVASRVLAAALLVRELVWKIDKATQGPWSKEQAVKDSVELADALLARIDETEAGR